MKSVRQMNFEAVLRNVNLPDNKFNAYSIAVPIIKSRIPNFNNRGFNQAILLAVIENRKKPKKVNSAIINRIHKEAAALKRRKTVLSPVRRRLFASPTRKNMRIK